MCEEEGGGGAADATGGWVGGGGISAHLVFMASVSVSMY